MARDRSRIDVAGDCRRGFAQLLASLERGDDRRPGVLLEMLEALDANPAAPELDDAAPLENVEERGGGLAGGADEAGHVLVCQGDEQLARRARGLGGGRKIVQ